MSSNQSRMDESNGTPGRSYQFGRFCLNIEENGQRLFSDGHGIALSTAESTILRVLLEKNGEFVTTEELLKSISSSPMASENLVHGAVRGLRRTLNDADLIRNERSKGYFFNGDVERRFEKAEDLAEANQAIHDPAQLPEANKSRNNEAATTTQGRDSFVIVALLVTAPVVLLPFGLVFFGGSWDSLPRQLGFIQALMILVAIGYDFYFSDTRGPGP